MTTITIQILKTNGHSAPGKLADAEIHFTGGELDGLKLVGFAVWQTTRRQRPERQLSRHASSPLHGDRRSFSLLRWIAKRNAQDRLEGLVIQAYADHACGTSENEPH